MVNLNGPWVVTCAISPSGRVAAAGGFDNNCALYRYLFNLKQEGHQKDRGRFPKTPGYESIIKQGLTNAHDENSNDAKI